MLRDLSFGEGLGPIFLDRVSCSSNSPSLLECDGNPLGVHTCSHSQDVGVQCIGNSNQFKIPVTCNTDVCRL